MRPGSLRVDAESGAPTTPSPRTWSNSMPVRLGETPCALALIGRTPQTSATAVKMQAERARSIADANDTAAYEGGKRSDCRFNERRPDSHGGSCETTGLRRSMPHRKNRRRPDTLGLAHSLHYTAAGPKQRDDSQRAGLTRRWRSDGEANSRPGRTNESDGVHPPRRADARVRERRRRTPARGRPDSRAAR